MYFVAHTEYQRVSAEFFQLRQASRTQVHLASTEMDMMTIKASQLEDGEIVVAARHQSLKLLAQSAASEIQPCLTAMPMDIRQQYDEIAACIMRNELAIMAEILAGGNDQCQAP